MRLVLPLLWNTVPGHSPSTRKDGFWWASRPSGLYPNPMHMDQQKGNLSEANADWLLWCGFLACCLHLTHVLFHMSIKKKTLSLCPASLAQAGLIVLRSVVSKPVAWKLSSPFAVKPYPKQQTTNSTYKKHDFFKGPLQQQDKHLCTSWCLRLENHVSGSSLAQAEPASQKGCAATGLPKWSTAMPAQHFSKQGKSN